MDNTCTKTLLQIGNEKGSEMSDSRLTDEHLRRFIELDDKENCTDAELDEWTHMRFDDQREVYRELLQTRARIAELEHPHVETGEWASTQHNPWVDEGRAE